MFLFGINRCVFLLLSAIVLVNVALIPSLSPLFRSEAASSSALPLTPLIHSLHHCACCLRTDNFLVFLASTDMALSASVSLSISKSRSKPLLYYNPLTPYDLRR